MTDPNLMHIPGYDAWKLQGPEDDEEAEALDPDDDPRDCHKDDPEEDE